MGFDLKKKKKMQGMCVLDGSSQSSGFITTLRTDVDVDWTKAETSRNHHDMMNFALTQDQPVDSDL